MFGRRVNHWLVLFALGGGSSFASAGQSDAVSFLVMGKTSNHRQGSNQNLRLLNYHFFAEIFVKEGGSVTGAQLAFPDGNVQMFEDLSFVQELHGGRYRTEAELDAAYPNGDYLIDFDTSSGPVSGRILSIRGTGEGASRLPEAPVVHLSQDGQQADPRSIDPERDLVVSWSTFEGAQEDPNGILDDLLFVVMGNCQGERTVHSGRPFEGTGHLDFRTESYTIPADKLRPGEPHQIFIEHARVDTSRDLGIVGLVTYAATTFLDFRTSGLNIDHPCPNPMLRIDAGQTDRPSK